MKWTVARSVLAGYLILVLLLIGTNLLVSLRLGSLDEDAFKELHTPKLDSIRLMLENLRVHLLNERSHVLMMSPDTETKEEAETARRAFLKELAEVERADWDDRSRAALSLVRRLHTSMDSSLVVARQLALQDTQEGTASAYWIYRKQIEPLQRELEGVLWRLMDREGRLERLRGTRHLVKRSLVSVTLVAVVLGIAVALITTAQVARPLRRLAQATRKLGEGGLGHQVKVESDDEVGMLARAFNEMSLRLERLDRFRSEFISNVSHELRTPLVSIQQAVSLLWDGVPGPLNDRQKDLLDIIHSHQLRLKKLIEELLDVSRLEAEEMLLQFQKTDMFPLVEECVRAIGPLAERAGLRVEIEAPEKLTETWIDQDRIKQVLINLLGNAVKFTPEGGRVTVRLWDENQELRCDVVDTGPGIRSDELEVVFDKFYQGRHERDRKPEGAGLGLTISRGIITAHSGRIWATSTLGEGATFSFSLRKPHPERPVLEDPRGER